MPNDTGDHRGWRNVGRAVRFGGKAMIGTSKVGLKVLGGVSRTGKKVTGSAARRVLGGTKYARSAKDVNGRVADALRVLDAALRTRDARIEQLEQELERLKRGFRRRGRRVGNDGDELDLPVEGTSPDLDVVDRTGQGNGNFVKVAGPLTSAVRAVMALWPSGVAQHQALETGVAAAHEHHGGGSQRPQPGVAGAREDVLRTEKDVRARRWLRHRRRL